jgi:hypothetical protein
MRLSLSISTCDGGRVTGMVAQEVTSFRHLVDGSIEDVLRNQIVDACIADVQQMLDANAGAAGM